MSIKFKEISVSLGQLMLDPNNYRLDTGQDQKSFTDKEIIEIQYLIEEKLVKENISDLKSSILNNGFLEVDKIVVKELEDDDGTIEGGDKADIEGKKSKSEKLPKYLVIEGNRRTSAFKSIVSENFNQESQTFIDGFPEELRTKINSINVILVQGTAEEIKNYAQRLMGIRHVSGPKKWGGYQSAKLINDMWSSYSISFSDRYEKIGNFLGIRPKEVQLRHQAYLAYIQMKENPNYGSKASSTLYTLFHEIVSSNKTFKYEWLGWSDDNLKFNNVDSLSRVYDGLLEDEDGFVEIHNPTRLRHLAKIISVEQVRTQIEKGIKIDDVNYDFDAEKRLSKIKGFRTFVTKQKNEELTEDERGVYISLLSDISHLLSSKES